MKIYDNIVLDKRDLFMSITPFRMTNGHEYHYVWWYLKNNPNIKFRKCCVDREQVDTLLKDIVIDIQSKMFM